MKIYSNILKMMILIISIALNACDINSHTEPELNIDQKEIFGTAIYINKSYEKPSGIIDTLFINERDTFELNLTSKLLNDPEYVWEVDDESVLEIIPIPDDPLSFYAVALSDSGTTTKLLINDAPNEAKKKLHVVVTKQWADPDCFKSVGKFGGHHYYINLRPTKWLEAKQLSEKAGGYLACINSEEENLFLNEKRMKDGEDGSVWIGLQYMPNGTGGFEIFSWVNGDEILFAPNDLPGPNGGLTLFFRQIRSYHGLWSNARVSDAMRFFLEME